MEFTWLVFEVISANRVCLYNRMFSKYSVLICISMRLFLFLSLSLQSEVEGCYLLFYLYFECSLQETQQQQQQ